MQAILDLRGLDLQRVAVEVKIDSAAYAGPKPNEQLRLTFMHGTVVPRVTARMIFGRVNENRITLRGEAGGGGTEIPPIVMSPRPRLDQPIVIRLELDTVTDTYRIGSRADPRRLNSRTTERARWQPTEKRTTWDSIR